MASQEEINRTAIDLHSSGVTDRDTLLEQLYELFPESDLRRLDIAVDHAITNASSLAGAEEASTPSAGSHESFEPSEPRAPRDYVVTVHIPPGEHGGVTEYRNVVIHADHALTDDEILAAILDETAASDTPGLSESVTENVYFDVRNIYEY